MRKPINNETQLINEIWNRASKELNERRQLSSPSIYDPLNLDPSKADHDAHVIEYLKSKANQPAAKPPEGMDPTAAKLTTLDPKDLPNATNMRRELGVGVAGMTDQPHGQDDLGAMERAEAETPWSMPDPLKKSLGWNWKNIQKKATEKKDTSDDNVIDFGNYEEGDEASTVIELPKPKVTPVTGQDPFEAPHGQDDLGAMERDQAERMSKTPQTDWTKKLGLGWDWDTIRKNIKNTSAAGETTKIKSDETQPEDVVIPAGGVHPGIIGGDSDLQKSAAENTRKQEETRSSEFNKKWRLSRGEPENEPAQPEESKPNILPVLKSPEEVYARKLAKQEISADEYKKLMGDDEDNDALEATKKLLDTKVSKGTVSSSELKPEKKPLTDAEIALKYAAQKEKATPEQRKQVEDRAKELGVKPWSTEQSVAVGQSINQANKDIKDIQDRRAAEGKPPVSSTPSGVSPSQTTSGRETGMGQGKTAVQPTRTWDEVAAEHIPERFKNLPITRRDGKIYAGDVEMTAASQETENYASDAPSRKQLQERVSVNRYANFITEMARAKKIIPPTDGGSLFGNVEAKQPNDTKTTEPKGNATRPNPSKASESKPKEQPKAKTTEPKTTRTKTTVVAPVKPVEQPQAVISPAPAPTPAPTPSNRPPLTGQIIKAPNWTFSAERPAPFRPSVPSGQEMVKSVNWTWGQTNTAPAQPAEPSFNYGAVPGKDTFMQGRDTQTPITTSAQFTAPSAPAVQPKREGPMQSSNMKNFLASRGKTVAKIGAVGTAALLGTIAAITHTNKTPVTPAQKSAQVSTQVNTQDTPRYDFESIKQKYKKQ